MLTVQYGILWHQVREPSGLHQMLLMRFRRTQVLTKLYDPYWKVLKRLRQNDLNVTFSTLCPSQSLLCQTCCPYYRTYSGCCDGFGPALVNVNHSAVNYFVDKQTHR